MSATLGPHRSTLLGTARLLVGALAVAGCRADSAGPTSGLPAASVAASATGAAGSAAGWVASFGPRSYARTTGNPQRIAEVFRADPAASYVVEVADVGSPGLLADVRLNGELLVSADDFRSGSRLLRRQGVTLRRENKIEIRLLGDPGATVRITVFGGVSTVGPQGGTVRAPGGAASVDVPPGALATPVDIAIRLDSNATVPAALGTAAGTVPVALLPDGLQFAVPATVALPYASISPKLTGGRDPILRHWSTSHGFVDEPAAQIDARSQTIRAEVSSFSYVQAAVPTGVGWNTLGFFWPGPTITYFVDPSLAPYGGRSAVLTALAHWQVESKAYRFVEAAAPGAANLVFRDAGPVGPFTPVCPNNWIVFFLDGFSLSSYKAKGGFTCLSSASLAGALPAGEQIFVQTIVQNLARTVPGQFPTMAEAVTATLVHELGHALGVAHATQGAGPAIMDPYIRRVGTFGELQPPDVAASRSLYAAWTCFDPPPVPASLVAPLAAVEDAGCRAAKGLLQPSTQISQLLSLVAATIVIGGRPVVETTFHSTAYSRLGVPLALPATAADATAMLLALDAVARAIP